MLIYTLTSMGHAKLSNRNPNEDYPSFLSNVGKKIGKFTGSEPVVIVMDKYGPEKLEKLISSFQITKIIDNYDEQYAELLLSKNAHLYRANIDVQRASIAELLNEHYGGVDPWMIGSWVYFPWNGNLVHVLRQNDFEDLRSIRNRDLITHEEQKILADYSAACFGMSVGSAGAQALAISGMSRMIKLIDGAVISGSNLNRILTGVSSVGEKKCEVIGRQIYEMNPYSQVQYFEKADRDNIEEIIKGKNPVNIAIDEVDDIEMKVKIRLEARKAGIPVVMATELGDTVMLDVERFDVEPGRKLFHDAIKKIEQIAENPPENYREWTKHAVNIIDPKNMPLKMQKSVIKIGTNIVTHPQLGSTVMMTGGLIAFAVKNIALGKSLESGRYVISLENEMLRDHKTRKHKRKHKKHTKVIRKSVNSM